MRFLGNTNPPDNPQNLTATSASNRVTLNWTANTEPDLAKYRIYRSEASPAATLIDSVTGTPPAAEYVDNTVSNGTTYYYRVTAVDTDGNASGFSNEVEAAPGVEVAELLVYAGLGQSGGNDQGFPLNTWYMDNKHQSLYLSSDLSEAGISSGAEITAVEIMPFESPGQDLSAFRVATAWTGQNQLAAFIPTAVGYGPTYHYPADFQPNAWTRFNISPINWDGTSNLVVEFSIDNASYQSGGGVYLRLASPNRGRRGWSDDGAGSYPFDDSQLSQTPDNRVAAIRLVYTVPAVFPPTNVVLTPAYQQVNLSWTASNSSDVVRTIVYRGLTESSLDSIGSTGPTTTTFSDAGLTNGTTYWYALKARNSLGETSAMTTAKPVTPRVAHPADLTATAGSRQVTLNWTAPTGTGVARILLYRGTTAAALALIDSTTGTSRTITGLNNGTPYYFTARTRGSDGTLSIAADTVSATPNYLGPTWWVATNGSNASGDGSREYPYATIQRAINMAPTGDTVRIKPGTYTGLGNYNIDFMYKNLVVMGQGGADSVTIDVQGSATNRRRGFDIKYFDYSSSAKILGLSVVNGFAPNFGDNLESGGGILLVEAGSLQIENCKIGPGNKAAFGGGIAVNSSNVTIRGTTVKGNTMPIGPSFSGEGKGAGIYMDSYNQSVATIENCVIRGNQGSAAASFGNHIYGGGLSLSGNMAEYHVINTLIADNSLTMNNGGGWAAFGGGVVVENQATAYFIHCTIANNSSTNTTTETWNGIGGAVGFAGDFTTAHFLNSIIWGNTASDPNQRMFANWGTNSNININHCGLQEDYSGEANLFEDPLFTNEAPHFYLLSDASPMIGAGTPANLGLFTGDNLIPDDDKQGNPRPNPAGSFPDLGAFENVYAVSPYPAAPGGLAATPGNSQVTLTWDVHPATDVVRYGIYYGTSTTPSVRQYDVAGRTTVTTTVTGLSNNIHYYFRITAIDADSLESDFSDTVSATPQFTGSTIYVDVTSAATIPDGSSGNAYPTIMGAINAAATTDGKRILVLPGTYYETVDLMGKNVVLESSAGAATTIINAGGASGNRSALSLDASGGSSYSGYTSATKIIGFTFTNGDNTEALIDIDGPPGNFEWAPVFENCRFTNTTITTGSEPVILLRRAEPTFDGCEFRNLKVEVSSFAEWQLLAPIVVAGPWWDNWDSTSYRPNFLNCVIARNSAVLTNGNNNDGKEFRGGAVYVGWGAIPRFENTRIDSNSIDGKNNSTYWSTARGGGVFIDNWYAQGPVIQFINCSISGNTVSGMEAVGGGLCVRYPKVRLTNCVLTGNSARSVYQTAMGPAVYGGAVYFNRDQYNNHPNPSIQAIPPGFEIVNTTIADNSLTPAPTGGWGGAGTSRENGYANPVTIFNSIISRNTVIGRSDNTHTNLSMSNGMWGNENSLIDYSLVQYAELSGIFGDALYTFPANFAGTGDYTLALSSKAIGAGVLGFEGIAAPAYDYANSARPQPAGSNPDLGAYEHALAASPYPDPPQNLTKTAVNDSTVSLAWTANSESDIAKYRIYYGTASPAATLIDSAEGTTSRTVGGLNNGTMYYFRITAVNLDGYESEFSDEVSGTPKYRGPVWYVNESVGSSAYGRDGSPSLPFGDIGDALYYTEVSPGDTILVLPGTYNDSDDRSLHAPDFPFVLTSRDGPATTIIDLKQTATPKFMFMSFDQGCDTTTQVIGFTIKNGGGYETTNYGDGGAMRMFGFYDWGLGQYHESSPLIKNCVFSGNVSDQNRGGAVAIFGSSPVFVDCEFLKNRASYDGGAILVEGRDENSTTYRSRPVFNHCTFDSNYTTDNMNGYGGAISSYGSPEMSFYRCTFKDNSTWQRGGAIWVSYNAPEYKWLEIKNSLFTGNRTNSPGGDSKGAAIDVYGDVLQLVLEQVTITGNQNTNSTAAVSFRNAFIYNSIIWDNSLNGWDNGPVDGADGDVEIMNSLVENGLLVPGFDTDSGLLMDPIFSDPAAGDYTLSLASFALGAGLSQYPNPQGGAPIIIGGLDLAGNSRIQPAGSNPDLGAYESEYAETPYPDAPTNLTGTPLSQAVELNWNFPQAADVLNYVVYQSPDSSAWATVDTVTGRFLTRATITGLTNDLTYFYYVTAVDSAGNQSQSSNRIAIKPFYQGPVWYVNESAGTSATGKDGSPQKPFGDIGDVLNHWAFGVGNDTILVLPGEYNDNDDRNLMPPPIPFVLISRDGPATTIINLSNNGHFINVNHGGDFDTEVNGFKINNGNDAAIRVSDNSRIVIRNCRLIGNNGGNGGAVSIWNNSTARIENVLFKNNQAGSRAGAVYIDNNGYADISNCIFTGNHATHEGGAIAIDHDGSILQIANSLILNNTAETGPGGIIRFNPGTYVGIYNSIIWDNWQGTAFLNDINEATELDHCLLDSGSPAFLLGDNYSFDPMIVDPENSDYSLAEYSGAIGRGIPTYPDVFQGGASRPVLSRDFLGNARPNPAGSNPDIGPIEHEREVQRYFVYSINAVTGNDFSGDGLTVPFQSIGRGLDEASVNDTVEVAAGTYTGIGNKNLNFDGLALVLRSADGPAATIIDCQNDGSGFDFDETGEDNQAMVIGFTVRNGSAPEGGGVRIRESSPIFENMILKNNHGDLGGALYALNSQAVFRNTVIADNHGASLGVGYIEGGNLRLDHCTVAGNSANDDIGLAVNNGALTIHNSIVWKNSNSRNGIQLMGSGTVAADHSLIEGGMAGAGNYNGRPTFFNSAGGDLSLKDWSPAIGRADTTQYLAYDINGNQRSVSDSTRPDLGAYEHPLMAPDTTGFIAKTWNVNPAGSDTTGNGDPEMPFRTIQKAADYAIYGERVAISPGLYSQDFQSWGKDIQIRGNGPMDAVVIQGTATLKGGAPILEHMTFSASNPAVRIENSQPTLTRLLIHNADAPNGAVQVINSTVAADRLTLADNAGVGIAAQSAASVAVTNSIFYNTGTEWTAATGSAVTATYSRSVNSGIGNVTDTPAFRSGTNYRLLAHSMLINAGDPAAPDVDGTPADMGAFPYVNFYQGPTYYITAAGNDTSATGAIDSPFATIQSGVNFAGINDTVAVGPGEFSGLTHLRGLDIVLRGTPDATVLNGQGTSGLIAIPAGHTAATVIEHLTVSNGAGTQGSVNILASGPTIRFNLFKNTQGGSGTAAIVMTDASPMLYRNLLVQNNSNGVLLSGASQPVLVNNTIADNTGSGIAGSSSLTPGLRNSIVWNNAGGSLSGTCAVTYSDIAGGSVGTGNIDADPLFVNSGAGDYHLDLLSPAIDSGDPADPLDSDLTVADMGALAKIRTFYAGTSTGNMTVTGDSVVVVNGDFNVVAGDTLFLTPGATLYFNPGARLIMNGILNANGIAGSPVRFRTVNPLDFYGGIILYTGSGGRDIPTYSYVHISNVGDGFIPLTVNGSANIEHFTIAGNANDTSMVVSAGDQVQLNYSILEGIAAGTIVATGSWTQSTDQFVDYSLKDFNLLPTAVGIDIGTADTLNVDPDYSYSDGGAYYHDQSAYPTASATVLYPASGQTIAVSPDTSSTTGLSVQAQLFNQYGRFKTNGAVNWSFSTTQGYFDSDSTFSTDLDGRAENQYFTSTSAGDLNAFTVSAEGVNAASGQFLIEPGVPDSLAVFALADSVMTQLDTLTISAAVFDQFDNPVRDGESVFWSVIPIVGAVDGVGFSENPTLTIDGQAAAGLVTSPNSTLAVGDSLRIQAESNGAIVLSDIITIIPADIYNLAMPTALTENPIDLSADLHEIEISAAMVDTFGNPLEAVTVYWSVITGAGTGESLSADSSLTGTDGTATTLLTTGTLSGNEYQVEAVVTAAALTRAVRLQNNREKAGLFSRDTRSKNSKSGSLTRTGKTGFFAGLTNTGKAKPNRRLQVPVTVRPDNARTVDRDAVYDLDDTTNVIRIVPGVPVTAEFDLQADTVMTQFETLPVAVTVYDQYGNLVADDTEVQWSLEPPTAGISLASSTSLTTDGIAVNMVHTDPGAALGAWTTVQAVASGASAVSAMVTIVPDDPYLMALNDSYNRMPIADLNTIPFAVVVTDTFANPLEGIPVYWSVIEGSGGSLENAGLSDTTITDFNGSAGNVLTTATLAGSQYRVRMWTDNTGGFLLNARPGRTFSPALTADIRQTGKKAHKADPGLTARTEAGRSGFDLDDTTDVITVQPGVPAQLSTGLASDTVYVVQGQTDTLVIEARDSFGNLVIDGSPVIWNHSATTDFAIDFQENTTTAGLAKLGLTTRADAPWLAQIDFMVRVESGFDASFAELPVSYIVDDVIPPGPVTNLAITPAGWTASNSFALAWTNPAEHSGVAGAFLDINNANPVYTEETGITGLSGITMPANQVSTVRIWLRDLAGNVSTNPVSVSAKWDNVNPTAFNPGYPVMNDWLRITNPVFDWSASSDATAGLREYRFILDGNETIVAPSQDSLATPVVLTEAAHTWTVFAVDSAGNEIEMTGGPVSFSVDVTQPVITHNQVLGATANQSFPVAATFQDPKSGVDRAQLFYRTGGAQNWQTPVDMTSGSYSIANSFVTSMGVEYYLEAEDVAGNITRKPATDFYSVPVTIGGTGLSSTKAWPTGIPNGTTVSAYQLISFPGAAANNTPTDILVDDLNSYDDTKWRFFTYASDQWLEFAQISTIMPGVGYFLIVKDPGKNITTGQANSVATNQPFEFNLIGEQWKMIGNPFDFEIPLENLVNSDSIPMTEDLNFKTWEDNQWKPATSFKPWMGYIYKTSGDGKLFINPRRTNGGQARMAAERQIDVNEGEWLIDVVAVSGEARDADNRVGVLNGAADRYDRLDLYEPPLVPGGISFRIDNRSWETAGDLYSHDIKLPNEEGQFWNAEVAAGTPRSDVTLTFAGVADVPAEFDAFLIDLSLGIAQNLKQNPDYRYAGSSTERIRTLRLVVGTRDYVNANNAGVSLYPAGYSLSQNFPNPFNPQTTILVSLEDEAVLNLAVYNLLGEEICTLAADKLLPAGFYPFIWQGLNRQGNRVASGVYLYTSTIRSPQGKLLLQRTQKMVLIK